MITGAGSGLGRASAVRFAEEGARVVVADLNPDGAEATVGEIEQAGGEAIAVQVDVRDGAAIDEMVGAAVSRFGGIDILFNNAGVGS